MKESKDGIFWENNTSCIIWRGQSAVGHGREGVTNSVLEGRWESSSVSPGPALTQNEEKDTLKEHRDKAGELSGG